MAVSQRGMEYCMQADSGMATGRYFVDSCCSKTIDRDRHLLKNVRPLTMPARVAGFSGIKTINQQADLHLPVTHVNGKQTVIVLEGVYYYPDVKYNLVSVAELAGMITSHDSTSKQVRYAGPRGSSPSYTPAMCMQSMPT